MTNRVHIDAPAGVIDLEGEKEFVEGMLAKLFPLIEEAGFGSRPQNPAATDDDASKNTPDITIAADAEMENSAKKSKRKKTANPPAGQSCCARILTLKADNFFKQHRTGAEIVDELARKGWTHNLNQVGAATTNMHKSGKLQRTKEKDGPWKYYWDRD